MPIKVIRLERGRNEHSTKTEPNVFLARSPSVNIEYKIAIGKYGGWHHSGKGYQEGSSVYLTSEIDTKISFINNSLESLKKDFNDNIKNSLGEIQKELISLKHEILSSKTFRESLKNDILEELKNEITGANNV